VPSGEHIGPLWSLDGDGGIPAGSYLGCGPGIDEPSGPRTLLN